MLRGLLLEVRAGGYVWRESCKYPECPFSLADVRSMFANRSIYPVAKRSNCDYRKLLVLCTYQFESDNYEGARALILLYFTTETSFCAINLRL